MDVCEESDDAPEFTSIGERETCDGTLLHAFPAETKGALM